MATFGFPEVEAVWAQGGIEGLAQALQSGRFNHLLNMPGTEYGTFGEDLGNFIKARQAEQDNDFELGDIGKLALGSVGFGVGGLTGANLATGNTDDLGSSLLMDGAALAAAPGIAAALPSLGLSTLTTAGSAGAGSTGASGMWDLVEGEWGGGGDILGEWGWGGPDMYPGDPTGGGFGWNDIAGIGKSILGGAASLFQPGKGGGPLGGIGGAAFNMTPFLLALAEANNQKGDIKDITNQLGDLENEVSTANVQDMVLHPYDRETNLGRERLTTSLGNRGVLGSSFANQDLDAFQTTRDIGRGDLATKALLGSVGTRGALLDQILKGTNTMHTNKNLLLGAGLNASGRMFGGGNADPFGLDKIAELLKK